MFFVDNPSHIVYYEASALYIFAEERKLNVGTKNGARVNGAGGEQNELARFLKPFKQYQVLDTHEAFLRLFRIYKDPKNSRKLRDEAKARIIYGNVLLVVPYARRYAGRGVPLLDLMQEGLTGIGTALEWFDEQLGHRFSTYATYWIRSRILRALVNLNEKGTYRFPVYVHANLRSVQHSIMRNVQRGGDVWPPVEHILEALRGSPSAVARKITPDQVEELLCIAAHTSFSLDAPIKHNGHDGDRQTTYAEIIADPQASVEQKVESRFVAQRLRLAIEKLRPQEAFVLRHRFGIDGAPELSQREIATLLSRSFERVRQIEKRALLHLKGKLGAKAASQLQELVQIL